MQILLKFITITPNVAAGGPKELWKKYMNMGYFRQKL